MDPTQDLHPGMALEQTFHVEDEQTAIQIGSGSSRVLATPWMIAFMERLSHRLLADHLPESLSSVGVHVDVHHLAPTPVGEDVRVRTEIKNVEGNRVTFAVEAWDKTEQVGAGEHQRVIIDTARFLRRVSAKHGESEGM